MTDPSIAVAGQPFTSRPTSILVRIHSCYSFVLSKITQIYKGTNQVQRLVMARQLLSR